MPGEIERCGGQTRNHRAGGIEIGSRRHRADDKLGVAHRLDRSFLRDDTNLRQRARRYAIGICE
jgi:hypothetical protein